MTREDLSWAAVLAGGGSRRFGSNKALVLWEGETLISRIVRQLDQLFDHVMIIADDQDLYDFPGCPVYPDLLPGKGPLGGLCSAFEHCGGGYLFLTACDMPFLEPLLVEDLRGRVLEDQPEIAAVRTGERVQPFQAFYRCSLAGTIDTDERRSLMSLFDRSRLSLIEGVEDDFININRPGDLERFRNPESRRHRHSARERSDRLVCPGSMR